MPQNLEFRLPWNHRVSPHMADARKHSIEWMQRFDILDSGSFSAAHYTDWRLAELAGYFYPEATQEGLKLGADLMGWYFAPFDDQFDGSLGRDPKSVASICQHLVSILDHPPEDLPAGEFPTARAFADLWRRSCIGMTKQWQVRAAHNWKQYLTTQVVEAVNRKHSRILDPRSYIWQGRTVVSAHVVNDLRERVSGFEVPDLVWYSQTLTQMRNLAAEFVLTDNDLYSLEKEDDAGDKVNNMILIIEDTEGLSRQDAISRIIEMIQQQVRRFTSLEQQLPELCQVFDEEKQQAVARYVDGLHDIMTGSYEWGRCSGRYSLGNELSPAALQASTGGSSWSPLGTNVEKN